MIDTRTPPPDGRVNMNMGAYLYQHGDRPLEGYTVQRAIGRGGFGEVYFALSDSGRQVAIKAILTHEQIELRGISACMNLKSPHLVTVYDVKHNDAQRPFVIMEYVNGPSLRDLLTDAPAGLGTQKAAFFLREVAKGLTFLHECGIVHRDLKPGNIFYEDGYVKIGDYGLSKAMAASVNSGQTMTVGTLHYMAPEIGAGKYDRSIDIYALGCMLYEMLTGQPPYLGQTPGEILMKHMTAEADLTGIEEPFATAVRRATAKETSDRCQSVQELVEIVFGSDHIRQSVSHFRPEELSAIAARVAENINPTPTPPPNAADQEALGPYGAAKTSFETAAFSAGQSINRITSLLAGPDVGDTLRWPQRRNLAIATAAIASVACGAATGERDFFPFAITGFLTIVGATVGALIAHHRVGNSVDNEIWIIRRLAHSGPAAVLALIGAVMMLHQRHTGAAIAAICLGLFIVNWKDDLDPTRPQRVRFGPCIVAGIVGAILGAIFSGGGEEISTIFVAGVLTSIHLVAQIAAPFGNAPSAQRPDTGQTRKKRGGVAFGNVEYPPNATPEECADYDVVFGNLRYPKSAKGLKTPGLVFGNVTYGKSDGERKKRAMQRLMRMKAQQAKGRHQHSWAVGAPTDNVSGTSWTIALVLALVPFMSFLSFPVFGMHRFYVGKIGTGILWACTLGLFGIGQIVDLVLIACGAFTDAQGKRVVMTGGTRPDSDPGSKDRPRMIYVRARLSPPAVLLTLISTLLLIAGYATAVALHIGAPEMIRAGVFNFIDNNLYEEITREMGYEDWPGLTQRVGYFAAWLVISIAATLTIFARVGGGALHIARGVVGVTFAMLTLIPIHLAFSGMESQWPVIADLIGTEAYPAALDLFVDTVTRRGRFVGLIVAAVMLLGSFAILLIPRRGQWVEAKFNGEKGDQS